MRFKVPFRGVHIGLKCVDGSDYGFATDGSPNVAHAHTTGHPPVGFVCAVSMAELRDAIIHEIAHLAVDTGHDDRWRRSLRRLGGTVPAAYKKRHRLSSK